jgi:hypothetical protein
MLTVVKVYELKLLVYTQIFEQLSTVHWNLEAFSPANQLVTPFDHAELVLRLSMLPGNASRRELLHAVEVDQQVQK